MEFEQREAIRQATFRRNHCCGNCGASGLQVRDGSDIHAMPGIQYHYCGGCGWSRPIKKRRSRKATIAESFGKEGLK